MNGLLRVNEKALNELDDGNFLELRKADALQVAYSQMLAMSNIEVLAKLTKAMMRSSGGRLSLMLTGTACSEMTPMTWGSTGISS